MRNVTMGLKVYENGIYIILYRSDVGVQVDFRTFRNLVWSADARKCLMYLIPFLSSKD
jgi:hypothetical protein